MRINDWSSDVCSSDLCPRRGRLRLQLQRLSHPARSLRHARGLALHLPPERAARARRGADLDAAALQPQPAERRRRLFPPAALRRLALGPAPHRRAGPASGDLLFPSLGGRSRPAALRRRPDKRRVGKECGSTFRSWLSTNKQKKNKNKTKN